MTDQIYQYVDRDRLERNISKTAAFGKVPVESGHSRTVLTGTEPNKQAREYFVEQLEKAGLDVRIDEVGNIVGRWVSATADPNASAVASGSHLDSVPMGGIFDGVLGVYGALEAVRAIQESNTTLHRPIDVVCFTEEEGSRFSDGVLGSSVATTQRSVNDALSLTDEDGTTLEQALVDIGFKGEDRVDASNWDSWLELHIEQSERLEKEHASVGIVTSITGTIRCLIEVIGEANHSGSTTMNDRQDALTAASELVLDLEDTTNEVVENHGDTVVGTVGKFDVEPNAINVVPGKVQLGVDVRDVQYETMEYIIRQIEESVAEIERKRDVVATFERPYDIKPIEMADRCVNTLCTVANTSGISSMKLHSGAGHDTMHVAKVTDAGLIFAPSYRGFSHSPQEWTDWSSCTAATQVLTGALADLACD